MKQGQFSEAARPTRSYSEPAHFTRASCKKERSPCLLDTARRMLILQSHETCVIHVWFSLIVPLPGRHECHQNTPVSDLQLCMVLACGLGMVFLQVTFLVPFDIFML